jgi:transposase
MSIRIRIASRPADHLRLIRFGGHLPKGGYDVHTNGRDDKEAGAVARDLDLTETALREWVRRAQADRTHGRTGLTTAEREELARLRKENREPPDRTRNPKKAAALFAKHQA